MSSACCCCSRSSSCARERTLSSWRLGAVAAAALSAAVVELSAVRTEKATAARPSSSTMIPKDFFMLPILRLGGRLRRLLIAGLLLGKRFLARQPDLPAAVDGDDLHQHLVAFLEHVLDLLDARIGEVADVHEA